MNQIDDGDERLRNLFSRLPRVKAPADFELRLARRLAGETKRGLLHQLRLRPYAVSGLGLLVVGALSTVLYFSRFSADPEVAVPSKDTITAPADEPGQDRPAREESPESTPAAEDASSRKGLDGRPQEEIGGPSPEVLSSPPPPQRIELGKTAPGQPMMIESIVPESTGATDSSASVEATPPDTVLAVPDSVGAIPDSVRGVRDSLHVVPDSFPDSMLVHTAA